MFKRVLNAKKNKRAVLAVVAVFLVMSAINAESYGVTIDFYGMAQYSGSNNLTFANGFVPVLPTQSDDPDAAFIYFGTATTPISIDRPDPYYGIAAVAYDLDYSVPEWDQSYNWSVNVMAKAQGSYNYDPTPNNDDDNDVTEAINVELLVEHFDLGEGSLQDFLGNKDDIIDQLAGFPLSDYLPTDYQIVVDDESGVIYAAITDPTFLDELFGDGEVVEGEVEFGGRIVMTAEPIAELAARQLEGATAPEPASMILFGSGLFGLFGARRKFLV